MLQSDWLTPGASQKRWTLVNVCRLMDLVLFEPEGDAANRLVTPVAGKGPALQGNDRVAQPVPLFLGNRSYISADSISKSHGKSPSDFACSGLYGSPALGRGRPVAQSYHITQESAPHPVILVLLKWYLQKPTTQRIRSYKNSCTAFMIA
jgi:hypothetical protein